MDVSEIIWIMWRQVEKMILAILKENNWFACLLAQVKGQRQLQSGSPEAQCRVQGHFIGADTRLRDLKSCN